MPRIYIGTNNANPKHIFVGHNTVKKILVGAGTGDEGLVWQSINPPAIQSFSTTPSNIDLDTRATGTITFNFQVTGTTGQDTYAQITELPSGRNIGTSYVGANGSGITESLPNILQPTRTTTYRLFARNDAGQSHRDTTITVTENPDILSFARTNAVPNPLNQTNVTYTFTARIKGYPQPTATFAFGSGRNGAISSRHFTPVQSLVNTWDIVFTQEHNQANDSITLTIVNTSGQDSETISNIGA